MPAVHTTITTDQSAVCMFDDEPFAVVVKTGLNWSIFDPRQYQADTQEFSGRPACGVAATREIGVRIACAHIG